MWNDFDGKPYSREEFLALLEAIPAERLHWCKFITVHNTAAPSIAQWTGAAATPAQRIVNLQRFYEKERGWSAGPHAFIPPDPRICAYGFTKFTRPGVHASCFNKLSIGLEMVGDFDAEEFTSGKGAVVRDNAIFVIAALHNKMAIRPDGYELGKSGLHFHIDCKRDAHECPGKKVNRDTLVAAVLAEMSRQVGGPVMAGEHDPSLGALAGSVGAAAVVASPAADEPMSVAATVPAEKAGLLDRFAPNAAKAEELANQGSRTAQALRNVSTMFWKFWGTVLALFGIGSQVDPAKGPAHDAGSWGSQHPFLLAFLCITVTALIITAYVYWKAHKAQKGLAAAAKDGRYEPRGVAA